MDEPCQGSVPLLLAIQHCVGARGQADAGLAMCSLLLRHGARPDIQRADAEGNAPLHEACRLGHLPVVDLLLHHGADPNATNGLGFAALHIVSRELPRRLLQPVPAQALAERLLQGGANPLQLGPDGQLPRYHARDAEVVQVLRRAEAWWRRRPLLLAREFGDKNHIVSRLLLDHLKHVASFL